jgi:hypothetical protein
MNRRLTEFQMRATCRELMARHSNVSGRQFRRELKERFGAVGKTEKVFEVWRDETDKLQRAKAAAALPTDIAELQRRLAIAETTAAENLARAELAEYRERAHQDHWAMEIDRVKREFEEFRSSVEGQGGGSKPFQV